MSSPKGRDLLFGVVAVALFCSVLNRPSFAEDTVQEFSKGPVSKDLVRFLLSPMLRGSQSAYDIMDPAQCHGPADCMPSGYSRVATFKAPALEVKKLERAKGPSLLEERYLEAMAKEGDIWGFVAWNPSDKTAIVSFRGTQKYLQEWLKDFTFVPVPYKYVRGAGMVHLGFQLVYEPLRKEVLDAVRTQCKGATRILVTGHSLGGAIAQLAALDIAANAKDQAKIELYTFAAPAAGDLVYHNAFEKAVSPSYGVINAGDIVPWISPYVHNGKDVFVAGGFNLGNILFAHGLNLYQKGLEKLLH